MVNGQDAGCPRFLGWVDPPMCARARVIIPGLLKSKNKDEEQIKKLKVKLKKRNRVIVLLLLVLGFRIVDSMLS